MLRAVAGLLAASSRSGDVATRYGGEEFAILLPDTDADGAKVVAERCRSAIERAGWMLRAMTASFGAATVVPPRETDESTAHILVAAADAALYRSKAAGRNRVTHTDGLDVSSAALPGFPRGVLVVQDDGNPDPEVDQNFKVVDWREIEKVLAAAATE